MVQENILDEKCADLIDSTNMSYFTSGSQQDLLDWSKDWKLVFSEF